MSWESILKKNCGCGKDPCKTYGMVVEVKKGKGERHFYLKDGKPIQWTGETHKHPDGTLMSGSKHVEGESKKLYHFYELSQEALKHLSKETTVIKQKIDANSMKEMMSNLNNLIESIEVTKEALYNTPKTDDNEYDHDAIRELLLQIEINLGKLNIDLGTLSEMDDFDFNI